ncbi:hypothetical protein JRQ81_014970 [Phrynocephalus forsythii]|uniref:Uncharacterized protein n=1 Tax=Phrynocephalus forsythii TaxID=171643 RepID=A0A9Q1B409_9SAUR|nr:hypothetical protein JRQ81_014970 [Phrynocephalus forsythii]
METHSEASMPSTSSKSKSSNKGKTIEKRKKKHLQQAPIPEKRSKDLPSDVRTTASPPKPPALVPSESRGAEGVPSSAQVGAQSPDARDEQWSHAFENQATATTHCRTYKIYMLQLLLQLFNTDIEEHEMEPSRRQGIQRSPIMRPSIDDKVVYLAGQGNALRHPLTEAGNGHGQKPKMPRARPHPPLDSKRHGKKKRYHTRMVSTSSDTDSFTTSSSASPKRRRRRKGTPKSRAQRPLASNNDTIPAAGFPFQYPQVPTNVTPQTVAPRVPQPQLPDSPVTMDRPITDDSDTGAASQSSHGSTISKSKHSDTDIQEKPSFTPIEDFKNYSQMVHKIAQVMGLQVQLPTASNACKFFSHLHKTRQPPLRMGFIPSMLEKAKEAWAKPSSNPLIPRRIDSLYKTHGDGTDFLMKHPLPNSVIVDATQNRGKSHSNTTPSNKEARKLDLIGRRHYSLASFSLRALNYLCAMEAYTRHLLLTFPEFMQHLPEEQKAKAQASYPEVLSLIDYQMITSLHITDAASKQLTTAIHLHHHAWLRTANITDDARNRIEDSPFDGEGLFATSTDAISWETMADKQFEDLLCKMQNTIYFLQPYFELPLEWNKELDQSTNPNSQAYDSQSSTVRVIQEGCLEDVESIESGLAWETELSLEPNEEVEESSKIGFVWNIKLEQSVETLERSVQFSFTGEASTSRERHVDRSSLEKMGMDRSA